MRLALSRGAADGNDDCSRGVAIWYKAQERHVYVYVCIFMHVHICDLSILTRQSIIKAFGRHLWETSHPS